MIKELLGFCDFLVQNKAEITLQAKREDYDFVQLIIAGSFEYFKDGNYIIFETSESEGFLIDFKSVIINTGFKKKESMGIEMFTLIDSIHGKQAIYSIGTNDEKLANKWQTQKRKCFKST